MKTGKILGMFFVAVAMLTAGKVEVAGMAEKEGKAELDCDVLIIGGGTGGVSAGVQASRLGANTIIVEQGPWLGGMLTSAGVGAVDGNYNMRGGIFAEFCDSLAQRYGGYDVLRSGWVSNIMFEPKVGAEILENICAKEENLTVFYNTDFGKIKQTKKGWTVSFTGGAGESFTVQSKMLLDGTELGDVAAAVGIPYRLGMDARADTGESIAPETANNIIQDLTYVAILRDYGTDVSIEEPEDYDPSLYEGCLESSAGLRTPQYMLAYGKMPEGNLYMLNWPIRGNDYYANVVEGDKETRTEAFEKAKLRTLGFVYYIQNELGMKTFGLAYDEFPTEDGFALLPYHREGRRICGEVTFTVDYSAKPYDMPLSLYKEGIAVGDYAVDHHHGRYPDYEGLPDLHFYPIPSFNVPLRALVPADVENFLVVDKAISVSNIMNGATRLQPVVMQVGQAAGALAAIAVRTGRTVGEICGKGKTTQTTQVPSGIREVQQTLLDGGGYIMPYIDLKPGEEGFVAIQKVGATGILRGDGKNVGWRNVTDFRINDKLLRSELVEGLTDDYPEAAELIGKSTEEYITVDNLPEIFEAMGGDREQIETALATIETPSDGDDAISRLQFCILLDSIIDLFGTR